MDILFIFAGAALWGVTLLLGLAFRRLETPSRESKAGEHA